jgi:predicted ATP-binding protein involved in virulence
MALDAAADYSEAQRWYYVRENLELREARRSGDIHRSDPVLDAVRSAIRGMLDGIDEIYADDDPPRIKARQRRDDGQPITLDFRQLSAGQRNLMAITIDFARRLALNWPGWDAPLEAPGIMLIDEIELNLHPAWQQTVIAHLRRVFPDTQVIVATHSPQVLTTLRREQIRVLGQTRQGSAVASAPLAPAYGELSSDVLLGIMGVDPVPPIPEREELRTLSALVDQGAYDTPDARRLLAQLREQLRADHPQLRRLERSIGRQRALKR